MRKFDSAVPEDSWRRVRRIGKADLLIGIPSFNNASTIGRVVQMAAQGMALHFPGLRAVVIDSDGGSTDGTRDVVESAAVPAGVEKMALTYQGVPGKGSAFRAVFEIARALGVRACVVVDSDLRSITPEWIRLLVAPVLDEGFGYVAPYYVRHKYDGTITNSIAYPLTRALYGVSVRQPIGGDFGFSAALLDHYLAHDVWDSDVARFGIDIWMTTTAINEGFRICQASLGAKIHDAKDPAASLGPMFRQVVGTLFGLMKRFEGAWGQAGEAVDAPLKGGILALEPEPIQVTLPAMIERFRTACRGESAYWARFLPEGSLREITGLADLPEAEHRFPVGLWARVVYDFAVAYHRGDLEVDRLIDSLTGLYYGRTASFCIETAGMSTAEAEAGPIADVARQFEKLKPYLVQRWGER